MSSLEKRHKAHRGSMPGHRKYSDGCSDTSSILDDMDREVSNLTDRAFRSLCIGEEAIYNDSEFSSSPAERHKAFVEKNEPKTPIQEKFSSSIQHHGETEAESEAFQHSYVDVTNQEQPFIDGSLSCVNNSCNEIAWQQSRSSSRVSSLIKAFSSGDCYNDHGSGDVILERDGYRDFGSESWDKSTLLSIQKELSEFSGYHQNCKSGFFQSYRSNLYASGVATSMAKMDKAVLMKNSKSKFKALNSRNFFFHSEFSPFQLWEEYNRFSFERSNVSQLMSATEFSRWYDSPMYKELKDNNRIPNHQSESQNFSQRQIQDIATRQRSRSTVIQKASAIEKRSESELASNYSLWKKNNNFVRNKLPVNRPSTVSPTNDRTCRPDSNLFNSTNLTHEIVVDSTLPSNVTPFNISQLLTPVIHTRQETETSEILQYAHTPSVSDYSSQGESDPKLQTDFNHLRDSYKSRASSLLFNLKDNRKRVKSTYSPTRFKGQEIIDHNKHASKLEGWESAFLDIVFQEKSQENLNGMDTLTPNSIQESNPKNISLEDCIDDIRSYDNLKLPSPRIPDAGSICKYHEHSEGPSPSGVLITNNLSEQDKRSLSLQSHFKDLNHSFSSPRPEIANALQKAYPLTHSRPAQSSKQSAQSDKRSQNDPKQRKDFESKTFIEYHQNETVLEKHPWDQTGSFKEKGTKSESKPFKGEIAALIEMDRQRKATAKQYSANDSCSVRKETYMQKVNEDIKLGRRSKEEETDESKTLFDNPCQHNQKTGLYGSQRSNFANRTSIEKEFHRDLKRTDVMNDSVEDSQEQNVSSKTMQSLSKVDQTPSTPSQDNKCEKTEELYSYQPYKYKPNKQWHMPDRQNKENIWTQKQSEKSGQIDKSLILTSSTDHNELSNTKASNIRFQDKDSAFGKEISHQNSSASQEDRFSIDDILAVRDNEQARRLKDNTFLSTKLQNETPVSSLTPPNLKPQDQPVLDVARQSLDFIQNDFQNRIAENASNDSNRRLMRKDAEQVTTRISSTKERTPSKQEILTSKLKAHAQKEISAIKEKELAKQGFLARNGTKHCIGVNETKEGNSYKKEITADKLNHLFQDITYSSVTQYKETAHNDQLKYASSPETGKESYHLEENQMAALEKKEKIENVQSGVENEKHASDEKDSREETSGDGIHATIAYLKTNILTDNQQPEISKQTQISTTSSEDVHIKGSQDQSNKISPNQDFTAPCKTGKCNPLADNDNRFEPVQHNWKERLCVTSQSNQTYSEDEVLTNSVHATKKDVQVVNSSLNRNLLESEGNKPGVEDVHVSDRSKINANLGHPIHDPNKNSSGITSQLTSSHDMLMFSTGIPPAKQVLELTKSETISNLQTSLVCADELKNKLYNPNLEASAMEIAVKECFSPAKDMASQGAMEQERPKQFFSEDEQELLNKSKPAKETDLTNHHINAQQLKAQDTIQTNQIMDSLSKLQQTIKISPPQREPAEIKGDCLTKKICGDGYRKTEDSVAVCNNQLGDKSDRATPQLIEHRVPKSLVILSENNDHKPVKHPLEVKTSVDKVKKAESVQDQDVSSQSKLIAGEETQKGNNQSVSMQNIEISNTALLPSKDIPEEEPMIYSICVSSATEAASEDEPMIYTICVSSKSHVEEHQNPVKQEKDSPAIAQKPTEEENVCIKKDREVNKKEKVNKQTEKSNTEEKSEKVEQFKQPESRNKPSVIGRPTTLYEDLLAKYGLPVRDHQGQFISKHMEGDKERQEMDEVETHRNSGKTLSDVSKKASNHKESMTGQPMKEAESKGKQLQECDLLSKTSSNVKKGKKKNSENVIIGNSTSDAKLFFKDKQHGQTQYQDVHNIESSPCKRNNNVLKEKKAEENLTNSVEVESLRETGNTPSKSLKKTLSESLTIKPSQIDKSISVSTGAPISNKSTLMFDTNKCENIFQSKRQPEGEGESNSFHPDDFMTQEPKMNESKKLNSHKNIHEVKQNDSKLALKREFVLKMSPNEQKNYENLETKLSQENLLVELNLSNGVANNMQMFSKDAAPTHVINCKDKVSRFCEDVSTVVKQPQTAFEEPKFHLEDIKLSTEEVPSSKEFIAGHKNQHQEMKRENLKGEEVAVVIEDVEKKVQKNMPAITPRAQNKSKTLENTNVFGKAASKYVNDDGKDKVSLNRGSQRESEKMEISPKEESVQIQELQVFDNKQLAPNSNKVKKESNVLGQSGHNDGCLKANKNRTSPRGKKELHVEATETMSADHSNTNQEFLGKYLMPQSGRSEADHVQLSEKNTSKDSVLSKLDATKNKVIRPEISAIADYARLKVIKPETDAKDFEIIPKTDVCNSNILPTDRLRDDSFKNVSKAKEQSLEQKSFFSPKFYPGMKVLEPKPFSFVVSDTQDRAASTTSQTRTSKDKDPYEKQPFVVDPNQESKKTHQSQNPQETNLFPFQTEGAAKPRHPTHGNLTEQLNISHARGHESVTKTPSPKAAGEQLPSPQREEPEELQYYTVNALDTEQKPSETPVPPFLSLKMPHFKSVEEKREDGLFNQSPLENGKVNSTGPRSNSSSPAMGKPIMFKVKDNTMRASSVTKTVKPCFHRSFSDDFRIGSPINHSEKEDETHPKEAYRLAEDTLHDLKQTIQNNLPSAENAKKYQKSHHRRSQHFEDEETCSVISGVSEDTDISTTRLTDVANVNMTFMPRNERYRDNYQRPASVCYDRLESFCYERPESACSDTRSLCKPPTVPPKSEKALRRAQRLTTRRMKKTETPVMPENQDKQESKSIRNHSSASPPPSDSHLAVQSSPSLSQSDIQSIYGSPVKSIVAQPFPVAQRKLLQDPNSGEYFMVDVPVQVKTKTFYDPQTGKYVQLNVRQSSQGALAHPAPVEVLNTPYMLYRGFLPMPSTSLTPLRSSSDISTSAAPTGHRGALETANAHHSREGTEILYRSQEQIHNPSWYAENNEKHRDIITMSELEDFAMESI